MYQNADHCGLGNDGAEHVSEILKSNNSLTDLDISSNMSLFQQKELQIISFCVQKKGGNFNGEVSKRIFESLKTNNTLLKLDMSK